MNTCVYQPIYLSMLNVPTHFWKVPSCPNPFIQAVLWIRIRMDPELLPGSGSESKVPDPDPAKSERAYK